jgi:DnaJ-class molecular chaperone
MGNIFINLKQLIFLFLIVSFLGCNQSIPSDDLNPIENEESTFNESSLLGAWKYIDSKLGEVFIQFEKDGTVKSFYNYEGEAIVMGKWQLQGNVVKIVEGSHSIETELLVSDFDGSSFKVFNSDYNEYVVYNRLRDEAGEPILYYSLFDREPKRDSYYDASEENISSEIEENTSYNNTRTTQKQWVNCKFCNGTGLSKCRTCNGRGQISVGNGSAFGNSPGFHMENCYKCGGRGLYDNCSTCDGRGQVKE